MEGEAAFVVCAGCFHGAPVLVANAMVYCFQRDGGKEGLEGVNLGCWEGKVAREEGAMVGGA